MKANGSRREEREEKISRKKSGASPGRCREKNSRASRPGRGRRRGVGWRSMRGGPCARWLARGAARVGLAHSAAPFLSRRRRPRRALSSRVRSDFTCPKCSSQCSRSQPRECSRSRSPSRTRPARRSGLVRVQQTSSRDR